MGTVQLSDDLLRRIETEVLAGRASSVTAFVEEAVQRLSEAVQLDAEQIAILAKAGIVDAAPGRLVALNMPEVLRAALALLESTETAFAGVSTEEIKRLVAAGEASGFAEEDPAVFFDWLRADIAALPPGRAERRE